MGGKSAALRRYDFSKVSPTVIFYRLSSSVLTFANFSSVKTEIMQRLQRNFMIPGLRIDWA